VLNDRGLVTAERARAILDEALREREAQHRRELLAREEEVRRLREAQANAERRLRELEAEREREGERARMAQRLLRLHAQVNVKEGYNKEVFKEGYLRCANSKVSIISSGINILNEDLLKLRSELRCDKKYSGWYNAFKKGMRIKKLIKLVDRSVP